MGSIASLLNRSGQRPATDLVLKFLEHFAAMRQAMRDLGVWDDTDGLYYDKLITPDGTEVPVKVRSMVGIIPLLAAVVVDERGHRPVRDRRQAVRQAARSRGIGNLDQLAEQGLLRGEPGDRKLLLGVVGIDRLRRLFEKLFDEREFLSPVRAAGPVRVPPRPPVRARGRGHLARRSTTSRPSRRRTCSAATPTGGVRCGCRSTSSSSARSSATTGSSATTSRSSTPPAVARC